MKKIQFYVQGSAAEPYEVTFIKGSRKLTALCTCKAGSYGNVCKHRISILEGQRQAIVAGEESDVITVGEWLAGTDVERALLNVQEAQNRVSDAQAALKAAKKLLAASMLD